MVDLVAILRQRLSAKASITTADTAAGEGRSASGGGKSRASRKPARGKSNKAGKAAAIKSGASGDDLRKLSKAELYERAPATTLLIKADGRLTYKVVKQALLACEAAGFRGVALVAKKRGSEEGG